LLTYDVIGRDRDLVVRRDHDVEEDVEVEP